MSTAGDTITTGAVPRVVAGVNDSAPARAALRWAICWAAHTGARVVAIATCEPLIPVVADKVKKDSSITKFTRS